MTWRDEMRIATILFLVIFTGMSACAKETSNADAERLAVADDMISAWSSMEWERMFDLFADDAVMHSVMLEPIVGKAEIRERLALVYDLDHVEFQIKNKGIVNDVVMFERVDDIVYKGKNSQIPVVGVMEISNGKVDVWREYYDKASMEVALSPADAAELDYFFNESTNTVGSEILALTNKLSIDWNNGKMTDYLNAYSEEVELSLLFQSRVIASKQELTDYFTSSWKTQEAMGDFETDQVGVRQIASGTAIARGLFEHRFPSEVVRGAFTHVWQKTNAGTWKIIHEHTSSDQSE